MSYSQGKEEEVLLQVLNGGHTVGHFLDIGAFDGKTFSNTLRLAELGWSGVCIEPSPSVFPALLKCHANNPRVEVVNAALCSKPGFVDFYDSSGDALSTTHPPHKAKWEANYKVDFKKMMVYAISYEELFTQFGRRFDFINLDVEGLSADMCLQLPLQTLEATRCLCVEHDGKMDEICEYARRFGFEYVWHSGENVILNR